ncbi:MAG: hypothetical protein ABL993_10885 [Vicinamibacterales bacterium]
MGYSAGMRGGSAILALTAALTAAVPVSGQQPAVEEITSRASRYVALFFDRFSNVVAEERYRQDVTPLLRNNAIVSSRGGLPGAGVPRPVAAHRDLRSDFLLVFLPESNQTITFRDTFLVDGAEVRDRQERLTKLFLRPLTTAVEQARAIADESERYNIGNLQRTVNDPVLALSFLQADRQERLAFVLDKADPAAGADVWIVEYREQARPTFVRGPFDRDMPAYGRFWIEAATGRVVKTEFVIQDPSVTARVTTSFRTDDRFKVDVPSEMLEDYTLATTQVRGRATYGRFRQFGVNTDETLNDDSRR